MCYDTLGLYDGKPPTERVVLPTRGSGLVTHPSKTAPSGPLPRPSAWAGREASLTAGGTANSPSTPRRGARTPMGLGDILLYAFCAFIAGVFIFNLVDTAQTAKRKIAAKKHD